MTNELLSGSRWFQAGLVVGVLAVAGTVLRERSAASAYAKLLLRLHLIFIPVISSQALGHITAVTIRSGQGTLTTAKPLALLWGIGLVYLIPAVVLAALVLRGSLDDAVTRRRVLIVEAFLVVALVVAVFPGPLAIPGILNIVLLRRDTPKAQRAVVALTTVVYAGMFVASFFFDGP